MARIVWKEHLGFVESALDRGVLYSDGVGVAWNGLIEVDTNDTATIETEHYFEGYRRTITQHSGDFEGTLQAYTYPDEFREFDGFSEATNNKRFGLSFRTESENGYKLHLIYNAMAKISSRERNTLSDTTEASVFEWDISASAIPIPWTRPAAHLVIDAPPDFIARLEDALYGTDTTEPRLPTTEELVTLFEIYTSLRVTYNGDGSWTAEGPDDMVQDNGDGTFTIASPYAFYIDENRIRLSSYGHEETQQWQP